MTDESVEKKRFTISNFDSQLHGRTIILFLVVLIHILVIAAAIFSPDMKFLDYLAVWGLGSVFASIELASKYKDDPASVLTSSPGGLYIGINGLICISGLYLMTTFGLGYEIDDSLPFMSQRVLDVLQASLSSFFLMRSSFLKLGSHSQIDLGLNAILKKLLEIIDREVDRVRAVKRSNDITKLFKNVCHTDTKYVFRLCLNVMQNISTAEAVDLQISLEKLESLIGKKTKATVKDLNMMQLEIGLALYDIVGISVLKTVVSDLELSQTGDNKKTEPKPAQDKGNSDDLDDLDDLDDFDDFDDPDNPKFVTKNKSLKITFGPKK